MVLHGEFFITDKIHLDLPLNVVVQSEKNRRRKKSQKGVERFVETTDFRVIILMKYITLIPAMAFALVACQAPQTMKNTHSMKQKL